MIESVMIAVCDECGGAYLQSNGKIKFFPNKETALTTCIYSGWAKVNGKLYCPKCHEYNVKQVNMNQSKGGLNNDRTRID